LRKKTGRPQAQLKARAVVGGGSAGGVAAIGSIAPQTSAA